MEAIATSGVSGTTVPKSSSSGDNDCNARVVNWDDADSISMEWSDGHVPESFRKPSHHTSTTEQQKQYMRIYPKYHDVPACYRNSEVSESEHVRSSERGVKNIDGKPISSFVCCIDDAVPLEITNAIYDFTTQTNRPHKTWGTYITMQQVQQYWKGAASINTDDPHPDIGASVESHQNLHESQSKDNKNIRLDAIAVPAAAYFMKNYSHRSKYPNLYRDTAVSNEHIAILTKTNDTVTTTPDTNVPTRCDHDRCSNDISNFCSSILKEAHGVAIWALASDIGSEVPYHIDYAELLRYETGVIVPPIIAGTWHCTRNPNHTSFLGGDYCVVARGNGLDHYYRHGYKGKLTPVGETADPPDRLSNALMDNHESNDVLQIQYKFNRMICQSGHLPHWSTRVEAPRSLSEQGVKNTRVIVGFNVFLHDVGPVIQQAPEHSDAFRQRVNDRQRNSKNVPLKAFTTNPLLRRILVLAKRQNNLCKFKLAQIDLDERIQQYINSKEARVTVQQLLNEFTPSENVNQWPYDASDVLVHIHNACRKGHLRVAGADDSSQRLTKLIETDLYIECINKGLCDTIKNVN